MTPPRKTTSPPPQESSELVAGEVVAGEELTVQQRADLERPSGKGKRFLLTEERFSNILGLIQMGNYTQVACAATGIHEGTYLLWMRRGRAAVVVCNDALGEDWAIDVDLDSWGNQLPRLLLDNDWTCLRFFMASVKATAEAEAYAVGQVRKAMGDNWTAAMTFLERKGGDRWRRRDRLDVAAVDAAEQSDEDMLTPEAQELVDQALEAASRQGRLEAGD